MPRISPLAETSGSWSLPLLSFPRTVAVHSQSGLAPWASVDYTRWHQRQLTTARRPLGRDTSRRSGGHSRPGPTLRAADRRPRGEDRPGLVQLLQAAIGRAAPHQTAAARARPQGATGWPARPPAPCTRVGPSGAVDFRPRDQAVGLSRMRPHARWPGPRARPPSGRRTPRDPPRGHRVSPPPAHRPTGPPAPAAGRPPAPSSPPTSL